MPNDTRIAVDLAMDALPVGRRERSVRGTGLNTATILTRTKRRIELANGLPPRAAEAQSRPSCPVPTTSSPAR
jgi:hypothetical protein